MRNVGIHTRRLLLPALMPTDSFLEALDNLVHSKSLINKVAEETHDPRMSIKRWKVIFRREVLLLYRWASIRLLIASNRKSFRRVICPKSILTLLPQFGHASHVLRRAVPFAAVGLSTTCGFKKDVAINGSRTVSLLATHFAIEMNLHSPRTSCAQMISRAKGTDTLLIVTGKKKTADQITSMVSNKVLGATGRCSVVLGTDRRSVQVLSEKLRMASVTNSCNRLRASFVCQRYEAGVCIFGAYGVGRSRYDLGNVLRRLHPSVIYVPKQNNSNIPEHMHGYKVIVCDWIGSPTDAFGFGADPIYGWPGDYLL